MKYKRMRVEKAGTNGWTRWVQPVLIGYLMECCDCALVHRLNFRVYRGSIQFKVQRAPRYTARARARKTR